MKKYNYSQFIRLYILAAFVIAPLLVELSAQSNIKIGEQAPPIVIDKWLLNKPNKKSLNNKFIVLDFWATWCRPCLENVPHMNDLQERYIDKNVIFLQMTSESSSTAESVFDRVNFKSPVVTDQLNQTHINFGDGLEDIAYYPMVVLIDDLNIIRWFGSSEKLSISMMDEFLNRNNIQSNQLLLDGPHDIARDPETYMISEFGLEKFSNLFHDPNILFTSYIEEVFEDKDRGLEVRISSTAAILESKTLRDIFKILYPDKVIIVPKQIETKKYNFYFVNKELNSDSDDLLINDIADQLNLKATKSITNGVHKQLKLKDKSLLISPQVKEWQRIKVKDNGNLHLPSNTLTELTTALTKHSDYYWSISTTSNKRYEFDIDISNYEAIKLSLKCFGIEIAEIKKSIDLVMFTVPHKE